MRVYTLHMPAVSVSAAKDLMRITAASTEVYEVIRAELSQEGSETSDQLGLAIYRSSTAGTGTSGTARPIEVGDPSFAGTFVYNLSADTTKSPTDPLWRQGFNALSGAIYHPVPEERIWVPPSGIISVRLEVAPAAATTFDLTVVLASHG